jgi:hypothetical protein
MVSIEILWAMAKTDGLIVESIGPMPNGRYTGSIMSGPRHRRTMFVDTIPCFKTKELAEYFMRKIVDFTKKFKETNDLGNPEEENHPLHLFLCFPGELDELQDAVEPTLV